MVTLTKRDAEILDKIVNLTLEKPKVQSDSLPNIQTNEFNDFPDNKAHDYGYYISILEEHDILEITPVLGNGFTLRAIPVKTKNFMDSGGFTGRLMNEIAEQTKKLDNEKKQSDKLKAETRWLNLQLKSFWPLLIIASFGFVYSSYDFIKDLNADKSLKLLEQRTQVLELELSTLRSLVLHQENQDSLTVTLNKIDTE